MTITVQKIESRLTIIEEELARFNEEKTKLVAQLWDLMRNETSKDNIDIRFKIWVKYAPKKVDTWCTHITSSKDGELIEYDRDPIYPNRYEIISLEKVLDGLQRMEENSKVPEDERDKWERYPSPKSIHEWKQSMIDRNFGGCIWDW